MNRTGQYNASLDVLNSIEPISTTEYILEESVTKDAFMEEVKTYMTYKIASYIAKYWFPILVPIGLVGNTLSFLVMIKPNNRKMSTCIYMAAISINDNMMMLLAFHNYLLAEVKTWPWQSWECPLAAYLVLAGLQNSTYQVLAMTFDKYIAVRWPHRAATYSTPKRAKISVFIVYTFVAVYNTPHLIVSKLVGAQCVGFAVGGVIIKVYSWLSFVVNAVVPFFFLIHMNYIIVQKVKSSRKMFGSETSNNLEGQSHSKGQGQSQSKMAADKRQIKMKSAENQLTIMLLLVTTLFVILMIPTYIRFLYTTFASRDTPFMYTNYLIFYHISSKFYFTNNGLNFFLYCLSGTKFRNDLKELLCCGKSGSDSSAENSKDRSSASLTIISTVSSQN